MPLILILCMNEFQIIMTTSRNNIASISQIWLINSLKYTNGYQPRHGHWNSLFTSQIRLPVKTRIWFITMIGFSPSIAFWILHKSNKPMATRHIRVVLHEFLHYWNCIIFTMQTRLPVNILLWLTAKSGLFHTNSYIAN